MEQCKHCGSNDLVKNGYVHGKQRFLCKECTKTSRYGDQRCRYSLEQKIKVIKLYTEGMGLRSIERLEGISVSLLVYWIRNFSKIIRDKLNNTELPQDTKEVSILEVDELFTYFQKKPRKPMFGLLWTGTETKLLISE